ncbi:MAG: RHS repeat-associated core domain-containing protein, partial [Bacillota bacterium]
QDYLGTTDYLTSDATGKVVSWTMYNEWGEITHNAVLKCGLRELDLVKNYTGYEYDPVLGQYYAKNRMYDAENRRFTQIDPAMDGSNWYAYVGNNPVNYVDLLGLIMMRYENTVKSGEEYTYSEALSILQKWLVKLRYLDMQGQDYGVDYGGYTVSAVQLFQVNYGMTPTTYTVSDTYLAIANAVALKKYADTEKQQESYNINVNYMRYLDALDGYRNVYYRLFECEMDQGITDSEMNSMTGDVPVKKINGIYYFDYTREINRALKNNIQEFFDHRVKYSFKEYVSKFGEYTSSYSKYLGDYVTSNLLWFNNQVKPEAKWDVKLEKSWKRVFDTRIKYYSQKFPFLYRGNLINSEDLGNITFGYLGSAMGFSSDTLHTGAWIAGRGSEGGPRDIDMTNWGISLFFKDYSAEQYPIKF